MNKKKVAVVTWWGANNYGTVLQGLALVHKIETLGYNACLYTKYRVKESRLKSLIRDFLIFLGFKSLTSKDSYKRDYVKRLRKKYSHEFIPSCNNARVKFLASIDIFVTGSDQIWNTYFRYDPFYFLDFVEGQKCISYSSSIGTSSVNPEFSNLVKKHLQKFSHISLREKAGVDAIALLTGRKDIVHVLDPVYLLTENEWHKYSLLAPFRKKTLPHKYILCYFVGNNKEYHEQLETVKKKYGIDEIINVTAHYQPIFIHEGAYLYNNSDPFDFLYFIENATLICTDSFHATSLSLVFSKDFVLFKRFKDNDKESQNSRVLEILDRFCLQFKSFDNNKEWYLPIDYNRVQAELSAERERCITYLKESLEK